MHKKPLMLIILDGWGWREEKEANAILQATTPTWDRLLKEYPFTFLKASAEAVGLPSGVIGNSEVGHMNIGAGRIVYQDLTRISKSITEKTFFQNQTLLQVAEQVKRGRGRLHLLGLVSDGGVHSHLSHLLALLDFARQQNIPQVFLHCFMDGRDTSPFAGEKYMATLQKKIDRMENFSVATVTGRYFAMDRDKRWDRTEKTFQAMTQASGEKQTSWKKVFEKYYQKEKNPIGLGDEFIPPQVIDEKGVVQKGDGMIFINFRADRTRQLSEMFAKSELPGIFATMTRYEKSYSFPVLFPPQNLSQVFGEVISRKGLKQLRIAETEKYAHVTYFFNGGREIEFEGEDRCIIPSPKEVATYDLKPEMSATPVTNEVLRRLDSGRYDVIILNFANADMVGHSGKLSAAIKACETVDFCLGRILEKLSSQKGTALVTSDHGNSEMLVDSDGKPHTSHTLNVVPMVLFSPNKKYRLKEKGILADLSPTLLQLLNIPQPPEMTGESLIVGTF